MEALHSGPSSTLPYVSLPLACGPALGPDGQCQNCMQATVVQLCPALGPSEYAGLPYLH